MTGSDLTLTGSDTKITGSEIILTESDAEVTKSDITMTDSKPPLAQRITRKDPIMTAMTGCDPTKIGSDPTMS